MSHHEQLHLQIKYQQQYLHPGVAHEERETEICNDGVVEVVTFEGNTALSQPQDSKYLEQISREIIFIGSMMSFDKFEHYGS